MGITDHLTTFFIKSDVSRILTVRRRLSMSKHPVGERERMAQVVRFCLLKSIELK
jgi:hypothetical protein